MFRPSTFPVIGVSMFFVAVTQFCADVSAATIAGQTASAVGAVVGTSGGKKRNLSAGSTVYQNERIRTGPNSTAQFILNDSSKFAVGPSASVVLDRYVVGSGRTARSVTMRVVHGALRFASGRSGSRAYKIRTPAAALGLRGTLIGVFHRRGRTSVLVVNGAVNACGRLGCKTIRQT